MKTLREFKADETQRVTIVIRVRWVSASAYGKDLAVPRYEYMDQYFGTGVEVGLQQSLQMVRQHVLKAHNADVAFMIDAIPEGSRVQA